MKSRKLKWYSPRLMRRAGRPSDILLGGLAGFHLQSGRLELVAYADSFGLTRDGPAVTKEFARATADIHPDRLYLLAGVTRDGAEAVRIAIEGAEHTAPRAVGLELEGEIDRVREYSIELWAKAFAPKEGAQ